MNDQPVVFDLLPQHRPAKIHFFFAAGLASERAMSCGGGPGEIGTLYDVLIGIQGEFRGSVIRKSFLHSGVVFAPALVFQGRDVEKRTIYVLRIELRRVGGIEGSPPVPD